MIYTIKVEDSRTIWLYQNDELLGNLLWRCEDEALSDFIQLNDNLVERKQISNADILPNFLSSEVLFAIDCA